MGEATSHWEILRQITGILAQAGSVEDSDKRQELSVNLSDAAATKLDRLTDQWHKPPPWELFVYRWERLMCAHRRG